MCMFYICLMVPVVSDRYVLDLFYKLSVSKSICSDYFLLVISTFVMLHNRKSGIKRLLVEID